MAHLPRLSDLVDIVRKSGSDVTVDFGERAPLAAERAGLAEFADLVGFPVDDLPVEEPFIDFPPIEHGVIKAVEVFENDAESELVDSIDGFGIWTVTCGARLRVEGDLHSGLTEPLPHGWAVERELTVSQPRRIAAWLECTLAADVRLSETSDETDAALIWVVFREPGSAR